MVTQTQSYLCGSVPVQKPLSKLLEVQGERRQCGPAMGRSEEARQRHCEGLHLGLNDVRAPALTAKHASQPQLRFSERDMRLLSLAIRVAHAITCRKWLFILTDEVSRCLHPHDGVKRAYKALPKGPVNAPAWRRSSLQPPPQRWQQIGSSSPRQGGAKRETSEKVCRNTRSTGQLATLLKATQWPGWSSSSQPRPSTLRNSPLPPREQDPVRHTPSQSALGNPHGQPA
jgi:hypothetical protein